MDERDFTSRRPRHEAQPERECPLIITVMETQETFSAHLADLSRQGLKAVTAHEIPENEAVQIQIDLPNGRMPLSGGARVRWTQHQDNGHWALGLSFDAELSWEAMGELFLCGVLSRDTAYRFRTPYSA